MRTVSRARLVACCAILLVACSSVSRTESPASSASASPSATPTATSRAAPSQSPSASASASASVTYVAIGASDTVGVGASDPSRASWPARVAQKLPASADYLNLGVSGSLTLQAKSEQLPSALARRPTLVTIWLAVNDLNAQVDPTTYANTLGGIVDALVQGTAATVFVGNVPDLRAVPVYAQVDKTALLARITAYNQAIAQVVAAHPRRVVLVDLFTGSADLVTSGTVASDGFHPSDSGYQLIADRFVVALRANGVPLRP